MVIVTEKQRYWRKRERPYLPATPAPTLIAASYESQTAVTLTFAGPVVVTADSMVSVHVYDGTEGEAYQGDDFDILSPTSIRVNLYFEQSFTGSGRTMTCQPPTGIADADTAVAWAGVLDLSLPFP